MQSDINWSIGLRRSVVICVIYYFILFIYLLNVLFDKSDTGRINVTNTSQ